MLGTEVCVTPDTAGQSLDSESTPCPLCRLRRTESLESINAEELSRSYAIAFGYTPARREFRGIDSIQYRRCLECDARFFSPALPGSQELYDALRRMIWYYMTDKSEYAMAKRYIPSKVSVLDIGCGEGMFSVYVPECEYTGLEVNAGAGGRAWSKGRRVLTETVEQHAARSAGAYDVVCAFQVLEHVPDVHEFIAASCRVAKPGGLLLFGVPSRDSFVGWQTNALLNLPPHHLTHWSDRALERIPRLFPFDLVKIEHETLADIHRPFYTSALISARVHAALGRQIRAFDVSLRTRILLRMTGLVGKWLTAGLDTQAIAPRGHTVLAIYRKRAG